MSEIDSDFIFTEPRDTDFFGLGFQAALLTVGIMFWKGDQGVLISENSGALA
jgi:hypothetical protein